MVFNLRPLIYKNVLAYKHLKAIIGLLYFIYATGKETNHYDIITEHVLLLGNDLC